MRTLHGFVMKEAAGTGQPKADSMPKIGDQYVIWYGSGLGAWAEGPFRVSRVTKLTFSLDTGFSDGSFLISTGRRRGSGTVRAAPYRSDLKEHIRFIFHRAPSPGTTP